MNAPHAALAALLYARCGLALISAADLASCAEALPGGASRATDALAQALVDAGVLRAASDRAWSLTPGALAQISLPGDDLSLSPEEERQLLEALALRAQQGTLAVDDLHAVTRRFLEEVLDGAMIPDELLERIIDACRFHGRLTMSGDGGRYTIKVPAE